MGMTKDVRAAVEAELGYDPLIDASHITVKNIEGNVALNGTVPSYPQYCEAAAAARRVAGVTEVHNHLEVVLDASSYRDDAQLTTAANNELAVNITVPPDVEALASNGNVTLTGTVTSGLQRSAAEQAVSGLAGVRNVMNYIEVARPADAGDVRLHVQDALDRHALVPDDSDVWVEVSDDTVTLHVRVRTWAEHDAVVSAARKGVGVVEVRDDLSVTG